MRYERYLIHVHNMKAIDLKPFSFLKWQQYYATKKGQTNMIDLHSEEHNIFCKRVAAILDEEFLSEEDALIVSIARNDYAVNSALMNSEPVYRAAYNLAAFDDWREGLE